MLNGADLMLPGVLVPWLVIEVLNGLEESGSVWFLEKIKVQNESK